MRSDRISRRSFLTTAGSGAVVALAGCTGESDDDGGSTPTPTSTPTATPTPTDDGPSDDDEPGTVDGPTENVFYAFAPGQISVIDPDAGEVVAELTDGFDDVDWGDAVPSPDNRRLFVNDGTSAQVVVIDTERREVDSRVEVGPDPVHMYHPLENELWTHSDEEGAFYVVDMESLSVTDRVVAAREDTGHGKLAYHPALGETAYATNTNDPGVHAIDVQAKEATGFVELSEVSGTHAQRVNPVSGHAYIEAFGPRSRITAIDPADDSEVASFEFTGHIYNTPGDDRLVVTDKGNDRVHVVDAAVDEVETAIPVEGAPDKIFFDDVDDTTYGFTTNTATPDTAVIDFDALTVVDRVDVGDIARPEGAENLHRGGLTANGYFVTPASGDGVVSIVDVATRELHAQVPVADGVDSVGFVGSFD